MRSVKHAQCSLLEALTLHLFGLLGFLFSLPAVIPDRYTEMLPSYQTSVLSGTFH